MAENYIYNSEKIIFKHKVSENLECNAYSMHVHAAYEIIYFVEGDATHVIEDRKYKLKAGDLIIIRPLRYHFIQIDSPARYERYDILFDPVRNKVEGVPLIPADVEIINIFDNPLATDVFNKFDAYKKGYDNDTFERIAPILISELLYSIGLMDSTPPSDIATASAIISGAIKYINENICTLKSVSEIASSLFVSESYLFRLFKKELHKTPKKYIMEKRLLFASKRIKNGERPLEAALSCGFSDYTTFYRNYTAYFGYPPSRKE